MSSDLRDGRLAQKLATVFDHIFGQQPTFLTDSIALQEWLEVIGFSCVNFANHSNDKQVKSVVVMLTDENTIPPYSSWRKMLRNSKVLIFPLTSFDATIEAAKYTLNLLAYSDVVAASKANEQWLDTLMNVDVPLIFGGSGTHFECEIKDEVVAMGPRTSPALLPGEWEGVGVFFEVGMILDPDHFQPGYKVNGVFEVPGVCVAHHRQMRPELRHLAVRAWDLVSVLRRRGCFPLRMAVEDSYVTQLLAGGVDIKNEVRELTNPRYDLLLTEMAISTNVNLPLEIVNWSLNCQINEGVSGVHIGLGDGLTGAHIDFICPGVGLLSDI